MVPAVLPVGEALAPAKVNLFLHVGPPAADGYHPLASLVVFADVGDHLTATPAGTLSLSVTGPFSAGLDGDNLILKALRDLGSPPLAITLDKRLPIAAGLGGGSSDAGAALRLTRAFDPDLTDADLLRAAAVVGADGPMCLFPRAAWAQGRGDVLTPEPKLPPLHALLVNPGVPSPTGPVYRAYDAAARGEADCPPPPADWSTAGVIAWLADQRNDLEGPATGLNPAIGEAIAAVAGTSGVSLARMSGSGATVFGLCPDADAAQAAAAALSAAHPDWWIQPCVLGNGPFV